MNLALQKWLFDNYTLISEQSVKLTKKSIREIFNIIVDQKEIFDVMYPEKIMHCENAKFIGFSVGYAACRRKCKCHVAMVSASVKLTKSFDSDEKKAAILEKRKQTNLNKFGVDNPSKLVSTINKIKETKLFRHGDPGYNNIQQIKETVRKRYNVDSVMQVEQFKIKSVENRDQISSIIKNKETKLARYGDPGYNNIQQTKLTNFAKYGVSNPSQQHFCQELKNLLLTPILFKQELISLSLREFCEKYQTSNAVYYNHIKKFGILLENQFEKDVRQILDLYYDNIICRTRKVIAPYELDFYLPDLKIAIEANGSFWHCEQNNRGPNYHLMKTKLCLDKGIRLIHIWEHDWKAKKCIFRSILKNLALTTPVRHYARNSKIVEISSHDVSSFLNKNHLQGDKKSKINLGLFIDNELSMAMTFSKARYNKNYQFELDRMATLLNTIVLGGANKLFKHFVKQYNPESVITYSDRSLFTGNIYSKLGFSFKKYSTPNYFYTSDYIKFESRLKYQKHKLAAILDVFDTNLTEWENMQANGYDRYWDCGNAVYEYRRIKSES